jgi:hypothetical protein
MNATNVRPSTSFAARGDAEMAPTMPAGVGQFDELIHRAQDGLDRITRAINVLLANCRRLGPLLATIGRALNAALHRLVELVRRVAVEVGRLLSEPGNPRVLWETGQRWIDEVGGAVSGTAGTFTTDFLHGDDVWKGPAADAYAKTLPPQKAALEGVHAAAGELGDSLQEVAAAMVAFWVTLVAAMLVYVGEMVASCAATSTIAGAPAGVATAAAATTKFIGIFGGAVTAFAAFLGATLHAHMRLSGELADDTPFAGPPAGHWPVSTTTSLSDGSMSDGDDSDWRLSP